MTVIEDLARGASGETFVLPKLSAVTFLLRENFQFEEEIVEQEVAPTESSIVVTPTTTDNRMPWEK